MGTDAVTKPDIPETKKKDVQKEDDLSEEDRQLQEELNMLVDRLEESNLDLHEAALNSMCNLIKSSTTSMTSVPKPLKFMIPHYNRMKNIYENISDSPNKNLCADVLSVIAMTVSDKPESCQDTLRYRLLGTNCEVGSWGHEYVRHLTTQVVAVWQEKDLVSDVDDTQERLQCTSLVNSIVPYLMEHNAESEAIDLCIELEMLDLLNTYTIESNYQRVCLYLTSCIAYLPTPDNSQVIKCATQLYRKFGDLGNAVRCALRLNDVDLITELFLSSGPDTDTVVNANNVQRQLAYLLGKQGFVLPDDAGVIDEWLTEMLWNTRLSKRFLALGSDLAIMEPKVPEDIYKTHLDIIRPNLSTPSVDKSRVELAAAYVNGLVNCGFQKDNYLQKTEKGSSIIAMQKDLAQMSTIATQGWVLLWDIDEGLSKMDQYLYSNSVHARAGGLLGCGVVSCGVKNECDPAMCLLGQYVESETDALSRAAIIGLGIAYAGSEKTEVINSLTPVILDINTAKLQLSCLAALSAGMIAVGSLNAEVTSSIIQTMLERPASHWNNDFSKFLAFGLALTCLGRQEDAEIILASLEAVSEPLKSMAHMMCDFCAYAGSGNVLKIQKLLHILSEKYEMKDKEKGDKSASKAKEKSKGLRRTRVKRSAGTKNANNDAPKDGAATDQPEADGNAVDIDGSDKDDTTVQAMDTSGDADAQEESVFDFHAHQGLAALGVAAIAMGEEVGLDMAFRMFGHLLRFGELPIKRAIPLALALCYVSNPQLKVLDTLSKFSHDPDSQLSYNSILALGLVGAGTNNARLAAMLRQLAVYHNRNASNLFMVRLAQGLTYLGKGTMTLTPFHSDRFLTRPVGLAGLLTLLVACLHVHTTFMGGHDYLLFYLTPAIQPRLLMTLDENLEPIQVTVRVGQAVDVVGQAGRPKTITGFQTHSTPVLLSHGERAELASDEYIPVTQLPLEGFVVMKKNPDYEESVM